MPLKGKKYSYKKPWVFTYRKEKFSGDFPDQLGECTSLLHLSLGRNLFNGPLPMSLGRLSSLNHLDISENSLEGVVTESNKTRAFWGIFQRFDFASELQLNSFLSTHNSRLGILAYRASISSMAWTQKNLKLLSIFNTGISDFVPDWFGSMFDVKDPIMCIIYLSYNQLKGNLFESQQFKRLAAPALF